MVNPVTWLVTLGYSLATRTNIEKEHNRVSPNNVIFMGDKRVQWCSGDPNLRYNGQCGDDWVEALITNHLRDFVADM
jgi:hypothetical protein